MLAGSLLSVRWTRRGVRSGWRWSRAPRTSTSSGFRLHAGLKAALAQGTVPQFLAEYRSSLEITRREVVRFARDVSAARTLTFFGSAVAAALLLFVGVRVLALPFPVLVASLVLFARMAGPAQLLQQSAQGLVAYGQSFAAVERRLGKLQPVAEEEPHGEPLEWNKLTLERRALRASVRASAVQRRLADRRTAANGSGSAALRAPARRPSSTSPPGCWRRRRER